MAGNHKTFEPSSCQFLHPTPTLSPFGSLQPAPLSCWKSSIPSVRLFNHPCSLCSNVIRVLNMAERMPPGRNELTPLTSHSAKRGNKKPEPWEPKATHTSHVSKTFENAIVASQIEVMYLNGDTCKICSNSCHFNHNNHIK